MKVLVAAAGTGGHINPGIAIANKIKKEQPSAEITFVGTSHGLENDLVPRAGYALKTIEVYGISREISWNNIKKMMKTMKSFGQAKKLIREVKPDLVIGTGGYICGPIFLAATKQKIPTILHESNAFPGVTVKMLSQKVDEILVGFEDATKRLPKARKIVITGTPTKTKRLELTAEQKSKLKQSIGLNEDQPIVLVYGGSQGAKAINEAMIDIVKEKKNLDYQIIWAPGPKQYDLIKKELEEAGEKIDRLDRVNIVPYIYNMEEMMEIADLLICRSGAMTITEISIMRKPAILVPFPFAAENHQEYNAKVLVDKGAGEILRDKELTSQTLQEKITKLVKDPQKLKQMGERAKEVETTGVEDKIYQEIQILVKQPKNDTK